MVNISRRKFINISGVALGIYFLPAELMAVENKTSWTGTALGAQASMTLYHTSESYAQKTLTECVNEVRRLERVFSLFHRDSAIVALNKEKVLTNPPKELVELLLGAQKISQASNGAFDVTVQPLWILHASFFAKKNANPNGPTFEEINRTKKLIGWEKLSVKKEKIKLTQKGMSITLNGIAQGYITDKITELLERKGFTNVLVDLGEMRALGNHPEGRAWQIGVPYSKEVANKEGFIKLSNQAVASSGGYGTQFAQGYHHLFNPHTGTSANYIKAVSIVAPSATLADAISTAVAVMPKDRANKLLSLYPKVTAYIS